MLTMHPLNKGLTLKAPRKILEQTTIYFYFLFFRENNVRHYMWIVCQADDSHVMSSIISSENYVEHALKMSSASHDWRFKGQVCCVNIIFFFYGFQVLHPSPAYFYGTQPADRWLYHIKNPKPKIYQHLVKPHLIGRKVGLVGL